VIHLSVLIRDIDKEVYTKFKAKAAEQGLKIGEALTKAMEEWIKSNKGLNAVDIERKKNLATFRTIIGDLEKTHPSQWGLIAEGDLQCIKDTHEEIAQELKNRNLVGKPCYIFQIGRRIKKRTFGLGSRIK